MYIYTKSCNGNNKSFLILGSRVHPPSTYLSTENTRAILPMARILLRMTSLRAEAVAPEGVRGHKGSNRLCPGETEDLFRTSEQVVGSPFSMTTSVKTVYTHHNMLPHYTTRYVTFALYGFFLDFFIALHQLSGHIFGMRQSLELQLFSFFFWTGKCLGGLFLVEYQSDGMWREALENA